MTFDEVDKIFNSGDMHFFNKQFIDDYSKSAIYFLLEKDNGTKGKIVYVGQTNSLWRRIYQHLNDYKGTKLKYKKDFNGIAFFFCPVEDLNKIETYLINKFRPKYNYHQSKSVKNNYKEVAKYMRTSKNYIAKAYGDI